MGPLLILAVVAVLAVANVAILRQYRIRSATRRWWIVLSALGITGILAGVWGGFYFEYQPLPTLRVSGAPVPVAAFHLEGPPGDRQWVDFISPAPLLFALANVVIMSLLMTCPAGLLFLLFSNARGKSTESRKIAGAP